MPIWLIILLLLGVLKIPAAALLLWLPFRSDGDEDDEDAGEASDGGDGGIEATPRPPRGPHPRSPIRWPRRRGPHGSPASPARMRRPLLRARRRVDSGR